jgi:hypothetical protein
MQKAHVCIQFAIGPLPKCAGELCYGILALVPAQKDLSAAHSLSRLSFQAIGLRIGASAADAETRPLVAHEVSLSCFQKVGDLFPDTPHFFSLQTSKALQSVAFKRLPPDLATVLVPQQIGSIIFVPSEAVEEKKLSYISFAAEASIISAGGLHHNRLEAPAGPVALSPNFVALTTRAGGCGPRQGPRPDLQVARDSTAVAFPALIGFARWVGGQVLAATRDSDRIIFATLSTVRPSLIRARTPSSTSLSRPVANSTGRSAHARGGRSRSRWISTTSWSCGTRNWQSQSCRPLASVSARTASSCALLSRTT